MDRTKRVVQAFLNSAEGYFHSQRVLEDRVKGLPSFRWNYKDIRDFTPIDFTKIVGIALSKIDMNLYNTIPSTALNSALQCAIHCYENGIYQQKIDAPTYLNLLKILALKAKSFEG